LAACRTAGVNFDADDTHPSSVMGPDYGMYYQDEGSSFELGGSVSVGGYIRHKKGKGQ